MGNGSTAPLSLSRQPCHLLKRQVVTDQLGNQYQVVSAL